MSVNIPYSVRFAEGLFVFRSDAFDVFNHPNFGSPNLNVLSSSFGVTSTRFPNGDFWSARQLQLGLKLIF